MRVECWYCCSAVGEDLGLTYLRVLRTHSMSSYVPQLVVDTRSDVTLIPTINDPPRICEPIQKSVVAMYSRRYMR